MGARAELGGQLGGPWVQVGRGSLAAVVSADSGEERGQNLEVL